MSTLVPTIAQAIPSYAEGGYTQEVTAAVLAAVTLTAMILIAALVVRVAHEIVRVAARTLGLAATAAGRITAVLAVAAILIGLLNR
jgi:hypothetical protein